MFTFYRKGEDKKGNETLEAIQTAKLAVASGASKTAKDMQISSLGAGEYYTSMAAKTTKATDKGSMFYNVTVSLDILVSSALAMPETDVLASALTIPDSLSLGQYDTDALAGSHLDSASDKLFGESGTASSPACKTQTTNTIRASSRVQWRRGAIRCTPSTPNKRCP